MHDTHPEMTHQMEKITETLLHPLEAILSKSDNDVSLYYHIFPVTPVTSKYLFVVVKRFETDMFIVTAYFTTTIKKGGLLWKRESI